jgi:hypothetical protein
MNSLQFFQNESIISLQKAQGSIENTIKSLKYVPFLLTFFGCYRGDGNLKTTYQIR